MESYAIIAQMIPRRLTPLLLARLQQFPAVALLGPRQVGKTTLAQALEEQHDCLYLDLEQVANRQKLSDPYLYLSQYQNKLVILDEVQRMPDLFEALRGLIDEGRKKGKKSGRFLLLGSASIDLLKQSGESLAGRIAYIEMGPFDLLEVKQKHTHQLWIRGGFPDSYLASNEEESLIWRENFIRTYLERDIPQLGPRIPAETLRRFWTMLAHHQAGLLNAAALARGLSIDGKTVARYLDLMVDLLLVRRLMPFHANTSKRLVKSPKIYLRDSGLLHALLNLGDYEEVMSHPIVGASWEGFVIETLLRVASERVTPFFYRTAIGEEVNLVLEMPGNVLWLIEIKKGLSPQLEKGFYQAFEVLKPVRSFVVYSGEERYPLQNKVEVIGLREMASLLGEV